jgi:GTPase
MSVFTFDPNPPRVSSPWLRQESTSKKTEERSSTPSGLHSGLLSDYGVTKLEPEPQDGPTEYKLHLLLRPRRNYQSMSTLAQSLGSSLFRPPSESKAAKLASATYTPPSPSNQTRQARLEHLTTQLLWRLQQSCPYHAASTAVELVIPKLPLETLTSDDPPTLSKLIPGLEASRGALYEIGVADDGTVVGLTKQELDESLRTLRLMAASLGCNMEILRQIAVGECEWSEAPEGPDFVQQAVDTSLRKEQLWVAEALVTPEMRARDAPTAYGSPSSGPSPRSVEALPDPKQGPLTRNQLRVTLTGPTTSGKSTLLGTLSTGSLDDGRGRSRQSSLKHLHEVASGVTSSVAQELIGYNQNHIHNYSQGAIESWIDIHDFTKDGRLVFLLDIAGKFKFRRTILRGIVGWAPHWTLLCIAANDSETHSAPSLNSTAAQDSRDGAEPASEPADNLAKAHLDLCLKLELPLAIVVTKLDLASKQVILSTLNPILSSIKAAGRVPKILQSDQAINEHLTEVPAKDIASVSRVIDAIHGEKSLQRIVPIILTSAVRGSGIGLVHALLQSLPLPPEPTSHDHIGPALNPEQPACLFHIEDRFSLPASYASLTQSASDQDLGTVVGGYLRFGSLSIGDKVLVGPFPSEEDDLRGTTPEERPSPGNYGLSVSHPSSTELGRIAMRNAISASAVKGEWHHADIVSIRNLRLPVQTLQAGQAGSIGIIIHLPKEELADSLFETMPPSIPKLRKGMVLAIPSKHMVETGLSLQAASGLTASFSNTDVTAFTVGVPITIYVASVRAAARVLRVSQARLPRHSTTEEVDDVFALNGQMDGYNDESSGPVEREVEVQLELLTNREWMELGSRIVILEGAGLDSHVGRVIEIID